MYAGRTRSGRGSGAESGASGTDEAGLRDSALHGSNSGTVEPGLLSKGTRKGKPASEDHKSSQGALAGSGDDNPMMGMLQQLLNAQREQMQQQQAQMASYMAMVERKLQAMELRLSIQDSRLPAAKQESLTPEVKRDSLSLEAKPGTSETSGPSMTATPTRLPASNQEPLPPEVNRDPLSIEVKPGTLETGGRSMAATPHALLR